MTQPAIVRRRRSPTCIARLPFSIGPDQGDADAAPVDLDCARIGRARCATRAERTQASRPSRPRWCRKAACSGTAVPTRCRNRRLGRCSNPVEMANTGVADVADKLVQSKYIDTFKQIFGPRILNDPKLLRVGGHVRGWPLPVRGAVVPRVHQQVRLLAARKARLTQTELHGLRLFNDPNKANCAGCHLSQADGGRPAAAFHGYAVRSARRAAQSANWRRTTIRSSTTWAFAARSASDMAKQTQYCGMFLTPTLRNSATRSVFFHNGVYHTSSR